MRILHVFKTEEELKTFVRYNVDHCLTFSGKSMEVSNNSCKIMFRVIANEQDFMKICGYEIGCVVWHYTPEENIKKFVQTRIRYKE